MTIGTIGTISMLLGFIKREDSVGVLVDTVMDDTEPNKVQTIVPIVPIVPTLIKSTSYTRDNRKTVSSQMKENMMTLNNRSTK